MAICCVCQVVVGDADDTTHTYCEAHKKELLAQIQQTRKLHPKYAELDVKKRKEELEGLRNPNKLTLLLLEAAETSVEELAEYEDSRVNWDIL